MQDFNENSLSEEEDNWVRLSFLLIDEGTVWVRSIVETYLDERGLSLPTYVDANKKSLKSYSKGKQKLITDEQHTLLFPKPPGVVDAETFDLTLLVLVISLLRILDKPNCGWNAKRDPLDTELDKSSDLVRMRVMRNRLYGHIVKCAIDSEEFDVHWKKLVDILIRLGADEKKIAEIKDMKMTTQTRDRCAKRIVDLFTGDLPDMEDFAQDARDNIAERHREKLAPDENKGPQLGVRQPDGSWHPI